MKKDAPQSKLTETAHNAIVLGIAAGLTRDLCAASAGVARETFFKWVQRGKKDIECGDKTKYARLVRDIRKTEADEAKRLLKIIDDAAASDPKHWTAAAWKLERRYKEEYSRKQEINQHHSGAIESMAASAIDERIQQLMSGDKQDDNTI